MNVKRVFDEKHTPKSHKKLEIFEKDFFSVFINKRLARLARLSSGWSSKRCMAMRER